LGGNARKSNDILLLLKRSQEERLILTDRTIDLKPIVLVAERRGLRAGRGSEEGRFRAVKFIAVVVVRRTVSHVAAGLGDQVYSTARIASSLRAGLCLRGEFLNRIDRQHHASDSRDAALIDRRNVVPEV